MESSPFALIGVRWWLPSEQQTNLKFGLGFNTGAAGLVKLPPEFHNAVRGDYKGFRGRAGTLVQAHDH